MLRSVAALGLLSLSCSVFGHEGWDGARPDSHAPIGVMGDHIHKAGEWMLSYRYMHMDMQGNRDGTDRMSTQDVFARGYMVAPTSMTMDMHMFGVMYAPTDRVTLMAMAPYLRTEMDHVTRMGTRFTTRAEGFGDIRLTGLIGVLEQPGRRIHLNLGVSLPTGSIDERDDTPAARNAKLPYPMQLGSGTYDLLVGATYSGQASHWSWGAQALATVRTGENDNHYRLGNRFDSSVWLARVLTPSNSASLRVAYQDWRDIHGADPDLNPMMVPTADPTLRAGRRADLLLGWNFNGKAGLFKGQRLALEIGVPVYQQLDGPHLETDLSYTLGWQYAFK